MSASRISKAVAHLCAAGNPLYRLGPRSIAPPMTVQFESPKNTGSRFRRGLFPNREQQIRVLPSPAITKAKIDRT